MMKKFQPKARERKGYHQYHCSSATVLALAIVTLGSIFQIDFTSKMLSISTHRGRGQQHDHNHVDDDKGYSSNVTLDDWQGSLSTIHNLSKEEEEEILVKGRGSLPPPSAAAASGNISSSLAIHDERIVHSKLNISSSGIGKKTINVTIMMRYPRNDRMGSNLQRPLNLMAYAQCKGYNFCAASGRLGPAEIFGFPMCPSDLTKQLPFVGSIFETPINESGVYSFQRNDGALLQAISENVTCAYSSSFRAKWREMIFNIPYFRDSQSVASQELFADDDNNVNSKIKIAVHIRRGDISSRHPIYISDVTFRATIQKLKQMVLMVLRKESEVHIFSEAYGDTNWTSYRRGLGMVDYFHLAPQMNQMNRHSMDIELNLRDWKHFITADILVVGGTFSRIASYAREDPSSITGLPLTMTLCYALPCHQSTQFDWSGVYVQFRKDKPDDVRFMNFPHPFNDTNTTIQ